MGSVVGKAPGEDVRTQQRGRELVRLLGRLWRKKLLLVVVASSQVFLRRTAGTWGRGRTRAPCVCFACRDDSRHLILTQTETVQKDAESGWLLMLKTQPCVSFCASSMKTLPAAVLDSHHTWYRCSGHRARGILVAGILIKFSFKTNKHNSLLKSRDAEIVIL